MGDLSKGTTFIDGATQVDAASLHALVEGATLQPDAITGKTASSSLASGDKFLVHDASDSALRSVQFSVLSSEISALTTVGSIRKNVAQSHAFAVGDVVRVKADGTAYEKAQAILKSVSFATSDVNTSTNRITLPTNTISNGEPVILSSSGVLPAPLVQGSRYFCKKIDPTTAELYTDSGLTTIVDITDVGSGTHSIYNELERAVAVGIVVSAPDSSNFTVVFGGEATGLPATMTAGKVYYLSSSSAGAITATPPSAFASTVQPVIVATSTSSGIVFGLADKPVAYNSIRSEHVADKAIGRSQLSSEITQLIDRNIGSDRQTVLRGRKDANGVADFLEPGTGLQVVLKASVSEPCLISFANGFDDTNGYNFAEKITSDQNFDSLPASSEVFLYADRTGPGAITYSWTFNAPEYGYAKSIYRNRHAFPRLHATSTENGVTGSASSETAGSEAWKAFNGEVSSGWKSAAVGTQWIRLQSNYSKVVNRYSIRIDAGTTTGAPTAWDFQGSNNGTVWDTLDSRSGITWSSVATVGDVKTFECSNTDGYLYYRLNITSNLGVVGPRIADLTLCEAVDHYYVIPDGEMYYWNGSTWTKKNRVFVGEARTGASSVSSGSSSAGVFTYAIRGIYVSTVQSFTAGNAAVPLASAIGTNWTNVELFYRENGFYTFSRSDLSPASADNLIRAEIGYLSDAAQNATSTLGGSPRFERLYSSIVAAGADVTTDTRSLVANGASTTTYCEAFLVARRAF